MNINHGAFFELVRAGLWEKEARLLHFGDVDYKEVMRLAEEQSVVGQVTAGLEHVTEGKVPQDVLLQFIGKTLQIEQQNQAMNKFVARLFEKLLKGNVYVVLVKGQGVAQCYEKPSWRTNGDIDLLLDAENYERSKDYLKSLAISLKNENKYLHLGMIIDGWSVELHGTLRGGLLPKIDAVVDEVQDNTIRERRVRTWNNGGTDVLVPEPNNDVIFVFSHIVKHFYHEGIGLRQVCDWCRLMWTFRDFIDRELLQKRISSMGVMTEWKVFSSLAVHYLGMPIEALPFYDGSYKWKKKAERLLSFIIMTGNFGHNRDLSYYDKEPLIKKKTISFIRHSNDAFKRLMIFPKDTLTVWKRMLVGGIKAII